MASPARLERLTPKSTDFDKWYIELVRQAELADYAPVKGCMVIRPYGYALWEHIQAALDGMIKATGHENMYFPLLIPESYLAKEAEHVEGFAPEVAWVTHGGSKELEERLAIRPTSETIICSMYADWIHSYRDLPVLINQWVNVYRWEKRTRLFLRTSEFLWQEGHTFHETEKEATEEVERMLECYTTLARDWLALPVVPGTKTRSETFAGAVYTRSIEAMMSDGWALQAGTSHHLGQHFTNAYNITFRNRENVEEHPYQTSWGVSTRIIGAVIMAHGDDSGLILPPKVAPVQIAVVPIPAGSDDAMNSRIEEIATRFEKASGPACRIRVDRRDGIRPGEKFAHWELRGVPLRITIGKRDVESGVVTVTRRVDGVSETMGIDACIAALPELLEDAHRRLQERARAMLEDRSVDVSTMDALAEAFSERPVFANAPFCNRPECEDLIKEKVHAVTIRVLRDDRKGEGAPCIACSAPSEFVALIARAY